LAPYFWACDEAEHHGRLWECLAEAVYLMAAMKQRGSERGPGQDAALNTPPEAYFLLLDPIS
jgi:hypothetical protein